MFSKRLQLARTLIAMGAHRWAGGAEPRSLLVVNYHRLRSARRAGPTYFDDGVFDTDVNTFRRQMEWLKRNTTVIGEDGLLDLAAGRDLPRSRLLSAVTFDDGYVDCYTLAKPILDELDIRGIFFIPVGVLESRHLGWWDVAAYLLKRSTERSIVIDGVIYDLERRLDQSLRKILNLFKLERAERTVALLERLSASCRVPMPSVDVQGAELMTWQQIRQLRAAGHAIGSHTISHRVLATLDPDDQSREICDSRRELEAILGSDVLSFAYPVGGPEHFNSHSVDAVRGAGYRQAFTFLTGLASVPIADPYRIPRESATSFGMLKAKALLPRVMGIGPHG